MGTADRGPLVVLAVLLIAGCGAPAPSGQLRSPQITCTGVPQARCDEGLANALRSLPNTSIVSIEVVCVAEECTDQSGAMDTIVRTADGGTLRSPTNAWSAPADGQPPPDAAPGGNPDATAPPVPDPTEGAAPWRPLCQGVPAQRCELMAETSFGELSTEGVERVLVRCGAMAPCTAERGVGETVVTYQDGSTKSSAWEYELD